MIWLMVLSFFACAVAKVTPVPDIQLLPPYVISSISTTNSNSIVPTATDSPLSLKKVLIRGTLGLWGVSQVVIILSNAIRRLIPVAIQPFTNDGSLLAHHWFLYGVWCLYLGYAEGYKAFHLKLSPRVVSRAFDLPNKLNPLNFILSGIALLTLLSSINVTHNRTILLGIVWRK